MLKLLTPEWYAPPSGDDAEFEIRGLNYREKIVIMEMQAEQAAAPDKVEAARRLVDVIEYALKNGVSNWRNMPVPFSPDLLLNIPDVVVNEVAAAIFDRSGLTGEQEKNSSSPSTSRRREKPSTAPTAGSTAPVKKKATNSRASAGA